MSRIRTGKMTKQLVDAWKAGPEGLEIKRLQTENAKLRKLAHKMWKPFCWAQSGYDVCLSDKEDREIRDLAHELGVEVE